MGNYTSTSIYRYFKTGTEFFQHTFRLLPSYQLSTKKSLLKYGNTNQPKERSEFAHPVRPESSVNSIMVKCKTTPNMGMENSKNSQYLHICLNWVPLYTEVPFNGITESLIPLVDNPKRVKELSKNSFI